MRGYIYCPGPSPQTCGIIRESVYLVCILLGMPSLHLFTFSMYFLFSCNYNSKLILCIGKLTTSLTLRSDCQGLTLPPLLTPTVSTIYCDIVLIACHETSQFMLCDTTSDDVQKSPIRDLGSIGGNVDEVEISTVSTT